MMQKTILIVDGEQDIREILAFNLEQAGYRVVSLSSPFPADKYGKTDLILLDVMMPGMSGFEWAQMIRNDEVPGIAYDTPIIFLTALGEEDDQLHGFAIGADDYITKPFSIRLLMARIEAVLTRQNSNKNGKNEVCYEQLRLDDSTYIAILDGEDIGLTKMEYELLHYLLLHPGAVYSRGELLTAVWPENGLVLDRTVDVTVTRLRKKIGKYKDHIKAKTGYGYYWEK